MDYLTAEYYDSNSRELQEKYNNSSPEYLNLFTSFFDKGSTVLDIGCGSGRDLNRLLTLQFNAYGIEASSEMISESIKNYPMLKDRIDRGSLPDSVKLSFNIDKWDNIIIAAVLQHIPNPELSETILSLKRLLKEGGKLLISFPVKYPGINSNRDSSGRLFNRRSEDEYMQLFKSYGFTLLYKESSTDALKRADTVWTTLILRK